MSTNLTPKYQWQLREENHAESERLAKALEVHPVIAQTLVHRGIIDPESAKAFLGPSLQILPDPNTLPDFKPAIDCLTTAIKGNARIQIHGDYDADGISGSALLSRLFGLLGNKADVFIPDRGKDGYSLGARSLQVADDFKAEVIVTVDNGTSAIEQMEALAARGIEVVIIDHHPPAEQRPKCTALVNPWCAPGADADRGQGGDNFPWFCGTGVAWLLAWGLLREINGNNELPDNHRRFLFDSMGLAALATVADVMPLKGPNRSLVHHGLKNLKDSSFPGIAELVRVSKIRGDITSGDLGFRLGPRINAAGRMSSADTSYRLLASSNSQEASLLAAELEALNSDRKGVQARDLKSLSPQVEQQYEQGQKVLFTGNNDVHVGVLGIVAARFTAQYGLPTLAWTETEPGLARGSARAPEGSNLMALIEAARPLFKSCGGHARAAGFSFDPAKHDEIMACLVAAAEHLPAPPPLTLTIDAIAGPSDMSPKTVRELNLLEPYGEANREPIFCCEGASISNVRGIGKEQEHLEITLERNASTVRVLAWQQAERLANLTLGDEVDVAYTVSLNHFRGETSVQWTLKDIRTAEQS